ncbi:hypothetical protein K470DRAFT_257308 [Piedraia hortae CBS 480.64]|uniref:Uncharacterized protein n=1 Tax=Piedraia hortae CBS 480.64 TaxID=1314780 RepID=A0A6A7C0Y1_9PEZI|nr:hypothetical protein K470DRAFT_257308 [Piedraia hortae CBS 480.64]
MRPLTTSQRVPFRGRPAGGFRKANITDDLLRPALATTDGAGSGSRTALATKNAWQGVSTNQYTRRMKRGSCSDRQWTFSLGGIERSPV